MRVDKACKALVRSVAGAALIVLAAACAGSEPPGGSAAGSGDGSASGSRADGSEAAATPDAKGVVVADARVLDPLGSDRASVYAVLRNHTGSPDTLVAISSPGAREGSLHRMVESDGRMTMEPVPHVVVPVGASVRLAPGSLHGMLEGLTDAPAAGGSVEVTFRFTGQGEVTVTAPVVSPEDVQG